MRITVRCGVFDGGKPHGSELGTIIRGPGWFRGANDYDGLRWEERFYECPKHGALQVHGENLLHAALNPDRHVIMATRVGGMPHP